jgi:hypothetical protein
MHLARDAHSGHHGLMAPVSRFPTSVRHRSISYTGPSSGRRAGRLALGLLALLLTGWWLGPDLAHAKPKRVVYCFVIAHLQAAESVPQEVADAIRARLITAVDGHERLMATLPEDAPDPQADPDKFLAYMKRRKITPYRVTIEITDYRKEAEQGPRGQRLGVHVAMRMFGETMPVRVMAFSGDGAATVKLDVGKTVRPRDAEIANRDAIAQAVDDALAESIVRLDEKLKKDRKAGSAKKKR